MQGSGRDDRGEFPAYRKRFKGTVSRSVIVLQLGIQDHGIPFLDIRLTVGDDRAVFAADMIPVGMATMPTPKKDMTIAISFPSVVIG